MFDYWCCVRILGGGGEDKEQGVVEVVALMV